MNMLQHPWNVILWDFDGTIADTVPFLVNAHHVATESVLGLRLDDDAIRARLGEPARLRIGALLTVRAHDVFAVYSEHMQSVNPAEVALFEGIAELVAELADLGLTQVIVTSRPREQVVPVLENHLLLKYFRTVVALEDTRRHKPNPDPLRKGMAEVSAQPADSAYIGDAIVDMQASHAAGVAGVAVTWGAGTKWSLTAARPVRLATTVLDLRSVLVGFDVPQEVVQTL